MRMTRIVIAIPGLAIAGTPAIDSAPWNDGARWRRAVVSASTFVQRHDLWTDEQARRAKAVAQAIKKNKLELIRFSFADQHGVLRGKTVVAADAPALMQSGVTMTTTLLAKDTAHKTVYPVFTAGGGFAMEEMQGAGDFVMVADPDTFQVLPWAPNTGWLLCDIYFTNGKRVPFSTRQVLRDALARLAAEGYDFLAGLEVEFHLFKLENPRLDPVDATWPPQAPDVSLLNQGYQYLTEFALRSDRHRVGADPARRRGARHAAPLAGSRARAEPVRIHVPPAARHGCRRHDDFVPRRRQADRAPARPARQLHVPAGIAQSVFLGLASAPVADGAQRRPQRLRGRRTRGTVGDRSALSRRAVGARACSRRFHHADGQRL